MSNRLLSIPEISNLESGRGLIRIPMEQDVPFTPRVRALVDAPEFSRLSQISQLGLASRVYPGATHTRFEHALGVFSNALSYLAQLGRDPRFSAAIDMHQAEVLMAAALLHDLGHWPFCHPIEDMALPAVPEHEEFAAEFLSDSTDLAKVLQKEWDIAPSEVLDVLVPTSDSVPLRLMRSILSGPIDIDKMDYLDRDSLHAGVPYGRNFDRKRLIKSLVVNEAGDGLAISSKAKTAAELMVFARYVMFSEVYWHHAVRSATSMLARAFYDVHGTIDLRSLFRTGEPEFVEIIRRQARGTEAERLTEGIFGPRRLLYKRLGEFSHYQHGDVYERLARRPYPLLVHCARALSERLSSVCGEEVASTDVLIDAPPPHREIEFRVDIFFSKEGVYRPLSAVSPVVSALATTQFDDYVKRVRVFVHPRLLPSLAGRIDLAMLLHDAIDATA